MKTSKRILSLMSILAFCILLISSCSKHDDLTQANQTTTTPDGGWRVSYFFDSGDETSHFTGYTFTFSSNGVTTATNGSNTVTGTWSQGSSKFNISFGTTPVFDDLNDDWLIEEKTSTSIKLKDDNPTKNEQLQFVKL